MFNLWYCSCDWLKKAMGCFVTILKKRDKKGHYEIHNALFSFSKLIYSTTYYFNLGLISARF